MEIKTCEEWVINELNNKSIEVDNLKEQLQNYKKLNGTQANNIDILINFISRRIKADDKGLTMEPVLISESMSAQDSSDINMIMSLFSELAELSAKQNQNVAKAE